MNCEFKRKLPIPKEIKEQYPLTKEMAVLKEKRDAQIRAVFEGRDDRLLLLIGPCSADREDSVLEYLSRLRCVQEKVEERIFIIPRIYTGKPRTTGGGYKGMLHQPDPNSEPDMLKGVTMIRELHRMAIQETGFTCADEMLYTENHRYLSDLLSYVAIGARSVEDQQHRLTASALNIPVGMKNPTSGDLGVMLNSIQAAQGSHTFLYRGWEVCSKGNDLAHAILRGFVNDRGESFPNYHYEDLCSLHQVYSKRGLQNMSCIIDTNHANSGKQYLEQIRISKEVMHSRKVNPDLKAMVKGFMIESYLEDGCQDPSEGTYGKSITDPCLGWEKTERLILELADLV
jgi:3-deoxy-7-phosphoheptulonate synthase